MAVGLVAAVLLPTLVRLYTDYLWFSSLDYTVIFARLLTARLALGLAGFAIAFCFLFLNLRGARRVQSREEIFIAPQGILAEIPRELMEPYLDRAILGFSLLVAAVSGISGVLVGEDFLRFQHAQSFGRQDPVFGLDVGFYLFRLPFFHSLLNFGYNLVIVALIGAGVIYAYRRMVFARQMDLRLAQPAHRHLLALVGGFFLLKAVGYGFARYDLLTEPHALYVGPGYSDVHVRLPILNAALVGAAILGLFFIVSPWVTRSTLIHQWAVGLFFGFTILAGSLAPAAVQRFVVIPDQLNKEQPYLARHIAMTREAFRLDQVSEHPYPAQGELTVADLAANEETIRSIRLWDPRAIHDVYQQLQQLRSYYLFADIDLDRYTFGGRLRPVLVGPRQMNVAGLDPEKQTWVNRHLVYTHGYGLAMSPVSEVSEQGLPRLYFSDIPPVSTVGLPITRPEIYFAPSPVGSLLSTQPDYIVVNGSMPEFDYPQGAENRYTRYQGRDGIRLGALWPRLAFALRLADLNLMISSALRPDSRLLLFLDIRHRIAKIAPFLKLDYDPYVMIGDDGHLFWIQDAYTVSDRYPYANWSDLAGHRVNYVRNSVKIVVDAYDGTVGFYIADPSDPVLQTYASMFPGVFQPMENLRADVRAHFRYPEGLFMAQSYAARAYHVTDPNVFYGGEDLWTQPREQFGATEQEVEMQAYYVVLQIPDVVDTQFALMLPFVPVRRDNMVGWLAGYSDDQGRGRLVLFVFPKAATIHGPRQIEARIDQDENISRDLTLWSQRGSQVLRGNLLVIPIQDSILYLEPLFLQSEQARIPEMKRVIAAYGDRVAMRTTLAGALAAVLQPPGEAPPSEPALPPRPEAAPGPAPAAEPLKELLSQAQRHLEALEQSRQQTQQQVEELRRTLRELEGRLSPGP